MTDGILKKGVERRLRFDVHKLPGERGPRYIGHADLKLSEGDGVAQVSLVYTGNTAPVFPLHSIRAAFGAVHFNFNSTQWFTPQPVEMEQPKGFLYPYIQSTELRKGFDFERLNLYRTKARITSYTHPREPRNLANHIDLVCQMATIAIDDVTAELSRRDAVVVGRDPQGDLSSSIDGGIDIANMLYGVVASIELYALGRAAEIEKASKKRREDKRLNIQGGLE